MSPLCDHCHARPGIQDWVGELDAISVARNPSWVERWCRTCVVESQLTYARKIAATLPALEAEWRYLKPVAGREETL